ncbi:hypothetical protein ACFL4O_00730 [bacterium]
MKTKSLKVMGISKIAKKVISSIVLTLFALSAAGAQISTSVTMAKGVVSQGNSLNLLLAPEQGRVLETYKGNSGKTVICIQDYHCHGEVQNNIAHILSVLKERYGKDMESVFVEGSWSKLDTAFFKALPNGYAFKENLVEDLMSKGILTGPEKYDIMGNDLKMKLIGIESEALYKKDCSLLIDSYKIREKAGLFMRLLNEKIEYLKEKTYSKEALAFEALVKKYEKGDIGVVKYIRGLRNNAVKFGIDFEYKYPNLAKVLSLVEIYIRLGKIPAIQSQARLLEQEISEILTEKEQQKLTDLKQDNNNRYYLYLAQLIKEKDLYIDNRFTLLAGYIEYLEYSQSINTVKLVDEEENIKEDIKSNYAVTQKQKELLETDNTLDLYERFIKNSVTNEEADEFFTDNYAGFKKLSAFIDHNAFDIIWAERLRRLMPGVKQAIALMKKFYTTAEQRNTALVENTLKHKEKVSVIVVGGYHTDGITEILKDKGMSYIVIAPNVTQDVDSKIYENRIKSQEGIVKGTKGKLGAQTLAAIQMTDPNIKNLQKEKIEMENHLIAAEIENIGDMEQIFKMIFDLLKEIKGDQIESAEIDETNHTATLKLKDKDNLIFKLQELVVKPKQAEDTMDTSASDDEDGKGDGGDKGGKGKDGKKREKNDTRDGKKQKRGKDDPDVSGSNKSGINNLLYVMKMSWETRRDFTEESKNNIKEQLKKIVNKSKFSENIDVIKQLTLLYKLIDQAKNYNLSYRDIVIPNNAGGDCFVYSFIDSFKDLYNKGLILDSPAYTEFYTICRKELNLTKDLSASEVLKAFCGRVKNDEASVKIIRELIYTLRDTPTNRYIMRDNIEQLLKVFIETNKSGLDNVIELYKGIDKETDILVSILKDIKFIKQGDIVYVNNKAVASIQNGEYKVTMEFLADITDLCFEETRGMYKWLGQTEAQILEHYFGLNIEIIRFSTGKRENPRTVNAGAPVLRLLHSPNHYQGIISAENIDKGPLMSLAEDKFYLLKDPETSQVRLMNKEDLLNIKKQNPRQQIMKNLIFLPDNDKLETIKALYDVLKKQPIPRETAKALFKIIPQIKGGVLFHLINIQDRVLLIQLDKYNKFLAVNLGENAQKTISLKGLADAQGKRHDKDVIKILKGSEYIFNLRVLTADNFISTMGDENLRITNGDKKVGIKVPGYFQDNLTLSLPKSIGFTKNKFLVITLENKPDEDVEMAEKDEENDQSIQDAVAIKQFALAAGMNNHNKVEDVVNALREGKKVSELQGMLKNVLVDAFKVEQKDIIIIDDPRLANGAYIHKHDNKLYLTKLMFDSLHSIFAGTLNNTTGKDSKLEIVRKAAQAIEDFKNYIVEHEKAEAGNIVKPKSTALKDVIEALSQSHENAITKKRHEQTEKDFNALLSVAAQFQIIKRNNISVGKKMIAVRTTIEQWTPVVENDDTLAIMQNLLQSSGLGTQIDQTAKEFKPEKVIDTDNGSITNVEQKITKAKPGECAFVAVRGDIIDKNKKPKHILDFVENQTKTNKNLTFVIGRATIKTFLQDNNDAGVKDRFLKLVKNGKICLGYIFPQSGSLVLPPDMVIGKENLDEAKDYFKKVSKNYSDTALIEKWLNIRLQLGAVVVNSNIKNKDIEYYITELKNDLEQEQEEEEEEGEEEEQLNPADHAFKGTMFEPLLKNDQTKKILADLLTSLYAQNKFFPNDFVVSDVESLKGITQIVKINNDRRIITGGKSNGVAKNGAIQINLIESGECEVVVNGRKTDVNIPSVILVPAGRVSAVYEAMLGGLVGTGKISELLNTLGGAKIIGDIVNKFLMPFAQKEPENDRWIQENKETIMALAAAA